MKVQRNGRLKKSITLLLILALAMSLIVAGSAAHWSNHPTIPTATSNTASFQINTINQTVTFGQKASWTNVGAGKAVVNLSFDGAEYVMKEIKGYDFALIIDGSGSPNETAAKSSAKAFVANMLHQNPDARFTVMRNNKQMEVFIKNSNNSTAVQNAIQNIKWAQNYNADFVGPSCEVAYDLHKETKRENPLMIVIIGDGDWYYMPDSWQKSLVFNTVHRGDTYRVSISGAGPYSYDGQYHPGTSMHAKYTYNGVSYTSSGEGYDANTTYGTYTITKNGQPFESGSSSLAKQRRATWAKILYMNEYTQKAMRENGTVFAAICTGKGNYSYQQTLNSLNVTNFSPRYAVDEGYCFEIKGNTTQDYNNAFAELETAVTTRVVTMSTTIDNRYFTVDEAALAAGLPDDCTYVLQSANRGGVPVQDVKIIYEMHGEQTLDVLLSIPVTIKSDIPNSAFDSTKHLPVVYDGNNPDGAAGCTFTNLNGVNQDVHTKKVYIDVTPFAPKEYNITFKANFPASATNSQPSDVIKVMAHGTSLGDYVSVFGSGALPSAPGKTYTFKGWYMASSGGTQVTTATVNNIVFAQWTETDVSYNTTFKANFPASATNSQPSDAIKVLAHGASLGDYVSVFGSGTGPSALGKTYAFTGWYTQASGGTQVTTATGNQTVYAHWTETDVSYTISFDTNGGSGDFPPMTKEQGVPLVLPDTEPTRAGYLFLGWSETRSAATGQYPAGGSYTNDANATLYAIWGDINSLFRATAEDVILRGTWADEKSGDVIFWVSYDGAPITQKQLDYVTFTCAQVLHWENTRGPLHNAGTATLTGVTNGNFAQVKVQVDVKASGVSAVTMDVRGTPIATGYVITPGDVSSIYGAINASDLGAMSRVVNNVLGTGMPEKGLANNFDFEMMDMNKDLLINASDVGILSRIVNQEITI